MCKRLHRDFSRRLPAGCVLCQARGLLSLLTESLSRALSGNAVPPILILSRGYTEHQ